MPKTTWTPVPADEARALYPVELCRGPRCGAQMRRMLTEGGRRMPVDAEPVEDATIVVRRAPDGRVRAHVLGGGDLRDADETTWRTHWATCPDAPSFHRPKGRKRTARCAACQHPMDEHLAAAGDIYHPTCAPPDIRDVVAAAARATPPAPDDGQGLLL